MSNPNVTPSPIAGAIVPAAGGFFDEPNPAVGHPNAPALRWAEQQQASTPPADAAETAALAEMADALNGGG